MRLRDLPDKVNDISGDILDAAIEVHRILGPWFMESVYRDCLAHELRLRGHEVLVEEPLPLTYKTLVVASAFLVDLLVDNKVVVELKAAPEITDEHEAQLYSYLRASHCQLGILLNFHAPLMKDGFRRRALTPV